MTPAEARRLWVKALRSGSYEQGQRRLRDQGKFCCLGVACDLHMKHVTGMDAWEKRNGILTVYGEGHLLPQNVQDWLGLSSASGEFKGLEGASSLLALNDSGGSFDDIADIIESGGLYLA